MPRSACERQNGPPGSEEDIRKSGRSSGGAERSSEIPEESNGNRKEKYT